MSGFGGGGRYNNNNNNSGGRGGRSRGRGRGRGRGGRNNNHNSSYSGNSNNNNSNSNSSSYPKGRLMPCRTFTTGQSCHHGDQCTYAHVARQFASIDASSSLQTQNDGNFNSYNNSSGKNSNKNVASVSSVAIWETNGTIKIFTGSHDGYWRLWNTQGGSFAQEFEHNMGGPVDCLIVASNFLFCGFEAVTTALPDVPVGMIQAWNLNSPADPPLEFQMHLTIPYAHAKRVSALIVADGQKVISGSRDGSIRMWAFDAASNQGKGGFVLSKTLHGHAREVTGLAVADAVLWSSSTDGSIRIWNLETGECQHAITAAAAAINPQQPGQPAATGSGHRDAVTSLTTFPSPSGTFILSSSLDGDIKAWNGATGQCVASESHGEGVVTMAMGADPKNNPVLLIGLVSGNIMVRNLVQTPKMPAFGLIMVFYEQFSVGHSGAVNTLAQGPASTFYSGGADGKVNVMQFVGDLGL